MIRPGVVQPGGADPGRTFRRRAGQSVGNGRHPQLGIGGHTVRFLLRNRRAHPPTTKARAHGPGHLTDTWAAYRAWHATP